MDDIQLPNNKDQSQLVKQLLQPQIEVYFKVFFIQFIDRDQATSPSYPLIWSTTFDIQYLQNSKLRRQAESSYQARRIRTCRVSESTINHLQIKIKNSFQSSLADSATIEIKWLRHQVNQVTRRSNKRIISLYLIRRLYPYTRFNLFLDFSSNLFYARYLCLRIFGTLGGTSLPLISFSR